MNRAVRLPGLRISESFGQYGRIRQVMRPRPGNNLHAAGNTGSTTRRQADNGLSPCTVHLSVLSSTSPLRARPSRHVSARTVTRLCPASWPAVWLIPAPPDLRAPGRMAHHEKNAYQCNTARRAARCARRRTATVRSGYRKPHPSAKEVKHLQRQDYPGRTQPGGRIR